MYGRTNAGGGGISPFAFIFATYPVGSTCTVTDGNRTLKLKDTSGYGVFYVPYAATWTVTATDGTKMVSVTVEITEENQSVSVELAYQKYLVQNGAIMPGIGVAFSNASGTQDGNTYLVSQGSKNALFYASFGPVDLTAYQTLSVDLIDGRCWGDFIPRLAITKTATPGVVDFVAKKEIWTSKKGATMVDMGSGSFSLDVESFTGNYYCHLSADTVTNGYMRYSNMWLE